MTALLFPSCFLTTYGVAVYLGHSDLVWPYISDTGEGWAGMGSYGSYSLHMNLKGQILLRVVYLVNFSISELYYYVSFSTRGISRYFSSNNNFYDEIYFSSSWLLSSIKSTQRNKNWKNWTQPQSGLASWELWEWGEIILWRPCWLQIITTFLVLWQTFRRPRWPWFILLELPWLLAWELFICGYRQVLRSPVHVQERGRGRWIKGGRELLIHPEENCFAGLLQFPPGTSVLSSPG